MWMEFVNHDFRWTNNFRSAPVTALKHFQNCMIRTRRIMALGHRFMQVWIKRLARTLLSFDAVLAEELLQLLHRHFDALTKLRGYGGCAGSQGSFEVVEHGQQFMDKRFLLRKRLALRVLTGASPEIREIGNQTKIQVFLLVEFPAERIQCCRDWLRCDDVGLLFNGWRDLKFRTHGDRFLGS